ncbi:MAG TPA: oxygen-independent coproporphyrinogen III oxidase [Pseudolabrys sp.]|uniref:oxygen-independent coproporphyrinogen III oxidase n=1 Tax=Pseudolabrys sp. TaxID=1960880 RepID=UPI002DDD3749|nr:oxygen-independent coproporphyrinogen III oxidase [Pseudolabrys sp.]HEV2629083.1 oxygen-independent coproporphyrinogen III oxidase [Pseudolabrys sp.]
MNRPFALAERNVPRYTSYPTAPHFSAAVTPAVYRQWLEALSPNATLSLYIHVPFCQELCHYCGCNTRAVRKREPIDAYAEELLKEIALLGMVAGRELTHLHWGGGTPSILGPRWLETIADRLATLFDLSGVKEHAIELDPRRVDRPLVGALKAIGVTRASLGVQDVSEDVQRLIGRVQPFALVERAAQWLREAGIRDLNIDLMYGLPGQTAAHVRDSAQRAAALKSQRLALFGYAHVPWFKTHQRLIDESQLPGLTERLEQAEAAAESLRAAGYESVGLDHFALPDDSLAVAAREKRLRRNFQGYTVDEADALIGLGASAIGKLPQGFAQNAPDLGGYSRSLAAGEFPIVKGLALSNDDRLRAAMIERLMCDLELDLAAFGGRDRFAEEVESLAPLVDAGLARIEGEHIVMAAEGRAYVRIAAAAFDAHLAAGQKRHSLAI